MAVRLRRAAPGDRAVLERWDRDPQVAASGGEDDGYDWAVELGRDVPWQEILLAEEDGRPVGVVVVIDARDEESHYWGDVEAGTRAIDVWIGAAADRGRGVGTAMMTAALDRCFADPRVRQVLIDPLLANVAAQRFYRRLGFEDVGPRRFGHDECLVMRCDRAGWAARQVVPPPSAGSTSCGATPSGGA